MTKKKVFKTLEKVFKTFLRFLKHLEKVFKTLEKSFKGVETLIPECSLLASMLQLLTLNWDRIMVGNSSFRIPVVNIRNLIFFAAK
jgi:hypothetical protein